MDSLASLFAFYYFLELWRHERERDRLEAELASEVSGVFERPQPKPKAVSARSVRSVG